MYYAPSSISTHARYPLSVLLLCTLTTTIAWCANYLTNIWCVVLLIGCFCYVIHHAYSYKQAICHLIAISMVCGIGVYRSTYQTTQANVLYAKLNKKKCCVEATVNTIEHSEGGRYPYATTLSTQRIQIDNQWYPAHHTIQVFTTQRPTIMVADMVQLKYISITKPRNEDFCRYLIKEGIAGTCFLNSGSFSLMHRPSYSITRWLHVTRSKLLHRLHKTLTPATAVLFRSIFMGKRSNKNTYTKKIKQLCQAWGVSHHLARSGLHLLIIVLVWQLLLKLLAISLYKRIGVILFLTGMYHVLTWPSISFFRALWAFLLHHVCIWCGIPSNTFHLLALVALVTLLINPFYLFFLDFQLSFGTALALTWYTSTETICKATQLKSHP